MANGIISMTFGSIAMAASIALFLSPVPTYWRIWKNKSTEQFQPYPYMAYQLSCFLWLAYCNVAETSGFLIRCLVFCNIIGLIFESVYFPLFCQFTIGRKQKIMKVIGFVGFALFCLFVWFYVPLVNTTSEANTKLTAKPSFIIGSMAIVSGTLIYASPLSNIINAYKTKSLEYMPLNQCMAMFFNSLFWFIFATMKPSFDPYVSITNGIGTLLGLFHFAILHKFHLTFPKYSTVVVKRLEATLDVDPSGQYMVFNRVCPVCSQKRGIVQMFEREEKIKIDPSVKYVLYKREGSKSWRVHVAETTPDTFESCKALPAQWRGLSETSTISRKPNNKFHGKRRQTRGGLLPTTND